MATASWRGAEVPSCVLATQPSGTSDQRNSLATSTLPNHETSPKTHTTPLLNAYIQLNSTNKIINIDIKSSTTGKHEHELVPNLDFVRHAAVRVVQGAQRADS
jgi:hypothetical protein